MLKKAIKQLLFMIVPYGETIAVKGAMAKGTAIKFEKIDYDSCGDTYSKYSLVVEFHPAYPPHANFGPDEKLELDELRKIPNTDIKPDEMRRFDYLKSLEKNTFARDNWKRFSKNIGVREVTVSFELDD